MNLFEKPRNVQTRWACFENPTAGRSSGGKENNGAKGHAFDHVAAGETKTLLDVSGSGLITRLWFTINDRSPEMLRSLRIDMFWDGAVKPAVSCPLGDFFGIALGRRTAFECAFFSDPEGRSFNCFIPMPFRKSARITVTNESEKNLTHLFYDVDFLVNVEHSAETLYFHAHWRRESPNELGKDFVILPYVKGNGRFLGCNLGVISNTAYEKTWWGEGEVKMWFGDDTFPTICGTGTEDYIGTGWGQGVYAQRTQGSLISDWEKRHWAFYRYHVDDPVFFDGGCKVAIQTIGGCPKKEVADLQAKGAPLIPVTIDTSVMDPMFFLATRPQQPADLRDPSIPEGWCNFWRQDDWSGTAYFYLDSAEGQLPSIAPALSRTAGLVVVGDTSARLDA